MPFADTAGTARLCPVAEFETAAAAAAGSVMAGLSSLRAGCGGETVGEDCALPLGTGKLDVSLYGVDALAMLFELDEDDPAWSIERLPRRESDWGCWEMEELGSTSADAAPVPLLDEDSLATLRGDALIVCSCCSWSCAKENPPRLDVGGDRPCGVRAAAVAGSKSNESPVLQSDQSSTMEDRRGR
jgi:hypothetical protein